MNILIMPAVIARRKRRKKMEEGETRRNQKKPEETTRNQRKPEETSLCNEFT